MLRKMFLLAVAFCIPTHAMVLAVSPEVAVERPKYMQFMEPAHYAIITSVIPMFMNANQSDFGSLLAKLQEVPGSQKMIESIGGVAALNELFEIAVTFRDQALKNFEFLTDRELGQVTVNFYEQITLWIVKWMGPLAQKDPNFLLLAGSANSIGQLNIIYAKWMLRTFATMRKYEEEMTQNTVECFKDLVAWKNIYLLPIAEDLTIEKINAIENPEARGVTYGVACARAFYVHLLTLLEEGLARREANLS